MPCPGRSSSESGNKPAWITIGAIRAVTHPTAREIARSAGWHGRGGITGGPRRRPPRPPDSRRKRHPARSQVMTRSAVPGAGPDESSAPRPPTDGTVTRSRSSWTFPAPRTGDATSPATAVRSRLLPSGGGRRESCGTGISRLIRSPAPAPGSVLASTVVGRHPARQARPSPRTAPSPWEAHGWMTGVMTHAGRGRGSAAPHPWTARR